MSGARVRRSGRRPRACVTGSIGRYARERSASDQSDRGPWRNDVQKGGTCRHRRDSCGAAGSQLMSAASSPGRTWSRIGPQCRMSVLAGGLAAALRSDCRWLARVPGMARVAASVVSTYAARHDHSVGQRRYERARTGRVGWFVVTVSMMMRYAFVGLPLTLLVARTTACGSADQASGEQPQGVQRVLAHVKGIT